MKMYPLLRPYLMLVHAAALTFVCTAALAVSPPPDGGYPNENTAEGQDALFSLTSGSGNTALGDQALYSCTTGSGNIAVGGFALGSTTTGSFNIAIGGLASNTTGNNNIAISGNALEYNTTGSYNIAIGNLALYFNLTGTRNTAVGNSALEGGFDDNGTTGSDNTAVGGGALGDNTAGNQNTATGSLALIANSIGNGNTATGYSALYNTQESNNTAVGINAMLNSTSGSNNVALGANAGSLLTTGSNNIDIGNQGKSDDTNMIRIGTKGVQTKALIAGIRGTTAPGGIAVYVDTNGRLGTATSSARFKTDIEPMDEASESILSLEPVTFRYKHELDPDGIAQFGLVAEQVAKVNPDLVARDDDGKPYTVRYEAVNAMLLNEFLKAHRKLEQQDATISELRSAVSRQQEQIAALASQVNTVSKALDANN